MKTILLSLLATAIMSISSCIAGPPEQAIVLTDPISHYGNDIIFSAQIIGSDDVIEVGSRGLDEGDKDLVKKGDTVYCQNNAVYLSGGGGHDYLYKGKK